MELILKRLELVKSQLNKHLEKLADSIISDYIEYGSVTDYALETAQDLIEQTKGRK